MPTKRFEIVRTARQQKEFEKTWEYFCEKYRWINDPYAPDGIRYNLILPGRHVFRRRKVIGTIEFIPYNPNNPHSTVEGRCEIRFSDLDEIRAQPERVWEVDKVCLHQDYQRQGYFDIFPQILMDHAQRHHARFYLGLMEEKFCRMLRIVYGIQVVRKGKAIEGPKTNLVPVMFDAESMVHYTGNVADAVRND